MIRNWYMDLWGWLHRRSECQHLWLCKAHDRQQERHADWESKHGHYEEFTDQDFRELMQFRTSVWLADDAPEEAE